MQMRANSRVVGPARFCIAIRQGNLAPLLTLIRLAKQTRISSDRLVTAGLTGKGTEAAAHCPSVLCATVPRRVECALRQPSRQLWEIQSARRRESAGQRLPPLL